MVILTVVVAVMATTVFLIGVAEHLFSREEARWLGVVTMGIGVGIALLLTIVNLIFGQP